MEIVGKLVGFHPYLQGLHLVDNAVEGFEIGISESLGEAFAQPGVVEGPERPRAADQILPQPRLRLVYTHGGTTGEGGAGVDRVDTLLVHGVSRFVEGTEQSRREMIGVESGGD